MSEPKTYYHVASYRDWPSIRDNGLRPGADGHVWLFTDSDAAMRFKDAWDSSGWREGIPPAEWKVPPCIVVVRTDRAVPTEAGIPGAYWVEGLVTKQEVYEVIRPGDLHHYATKTGSSLSLEAIISVAEETMVRGRLTGRMWHVPASKLSVYPEGVWGEDWKAAVKPTRDFIAKVLRENGAADIAPHIKVTQSTYDMAGTLAATDGMNSITVRNEQVDTLTLLHECAHIINRTQEGEGHDQRFVQVAGDLYRRYISAEAAEQFLKVVGMSKTAIEDYMGGHMAPSSADDVAAPMHDVEEMMPDYYERPDLYRHDRGPVDAECARVIRSVRSKPDATVIIYRALPPGYTTINSGDWVTPSLTYARGHAMRTDNPAEDWPVVSARVPAKTLWTEGYAAEWGYSGPRVNARTAAVTAKTGEDYSDYVMVCLRPSEATRKVWADTDECTEDVDELHITLYYLGTTEDAGGPMGQERLYRGLYDFALHSGYRGLTGKINGFGQFLNDDGNVLISLWDIPGIAEFRTWIMKYCRDHGFEPRQDDHGFTPHMSLAYLEDQPWEKFPRLPAGNPEKEVFTSIWLVWGNEWQEIPLA